MFQSIKYTSNLVYNAATKQHFYEYELTDSEFGTVNGVEIPDDLLAVGAVIREYSKRNLNVAANLVKFFLYWENECGYPIADQIEWAEMYQPLFTPQIKADVQKYLLLL